MHDVTRGGLAFYESIITEGLAPIVSINVLPLVRHVGGMAEIYDRGAHFVITPQQSVPSRFIDPKAKSRSRLHYRLAEFHAARLEAGALALLTDEHGFITEGTGNNFFMARGGEIFTPKAQNILRGVSRAACMELAEKLAIPVHEADLEPYDVREADEAWSTSTTVCMLPITRFNFRAIGDGSPGPVYQRLLNAWSKEVGVDIADQARTYAELAKSWTP